ncbi:hypothetical protein CAOG_01224 [Capsaspora owczarzaki ATCC 30864]|uniref:Synergin gamma C-terminal domain-containing protein n=1 Tax=Capsaspora owczarzaki (strain ATCC 30864) TaxID=595528 RepID=A0A0D2WIS4_CAPO3|nr:hypothetical protein CAOG_01224 [Capsaspora owczarzaki ATCC 30864]KJE89800.1 hypothetical protein CAOG_001224 [Capsaspora owczarzaki ATCC 30864]|eukprot:XP_004349740.1 hypothetical protein CAOG_01224 [Capsaspora owczarzaki ATCC 30864]
MQFFVALGLIALAQAGLSVDMPTLLSSPTILVPKFADDAPSAAAPPTAAAATSPVSTLTSATHTAPAPAAADEDDFADFSAAPSLAPAAAPALHATAAPSLVPAAATAATATAATAIDPNDKYSIFRMDAELASAATPSVDVQAKAAAAVVDPNDKYGVFRMDTDSSASQVVGASPQIPGPTSALLDGAVPAATTFPHAAAAITIKDHHHADDDDDFGSFATGVLPSQPPSFVPPSQAVAATPLHSSFGSATTPAMSASASSATGGASLFEMSNPFGSSSAAPPTSGSADKYSAFAMFDSPAPAAMSPSAAASVTATGSPVPTQASAPAVSATAPATLLNDDIFGSHASFSNSASYSQPNGVAAAPATTVAATNGPSNVTASPNPLNEATLADLESHTRAGPVFLAPTDVLSSSSLGYVVGKGSVSSSVVTEMGSSAYEPSNAPLAISRVDLFGQSVHQPVQPFSATHPSSVGRVEASGRSSLAGVDGVASNGGDNSNLGDEEEAATSDDGFADFQGIPSWSSAPTALPAVVLNSPAQATTTPPNPFAATHDPFAASDPFGIHATQASSSPAMAAHFQQPFEVDFASLSTNTLHVAPVGHAPNQAVDFAAASGFSSAVPGASADDDDDFGTFATSSQAAPSAMGTTLIQSTSSVAKVDHGAADAHDDEFGDFAQSNATPSATGAASKFGQPSGLSANELFASSWNAFETKSISTTSSTAERSTFASAPIPPPAAAAAATTAAAAVSSAPPTWSVAAPVPGLPQSEDRYALFHELQSTELRPEDDAQAIVPAGQSAGAPSEHAAAASGMNAIAREWIRVLEASKDCLTRAVSSLNALIRQGFTHSPAAVKEAFASPAMRSFVTDTLEIYRVVLRLKAATPAQVQDSTGRTVSTFAALEQLKADLMRILAAQMSDFSISIDAESLRRSPDPQQGCGLCCGTLTTAPAKPASSSTAAVWSTNVIAWGGKQYHAPCANLWLNQVDGVLPALTFV